MLHVVVNKPNTRVVIVSYDDNQRELLNQTMRHIWHRPMAKDRRDGHGAGGRSAIIYRRWKISRSIHPGERGNHRCGERYYGQHRINQTLEAYCNRNRSQWQRLGGFDPRQTGPRPTRRSHPLESHGFRTKRC